MAMRLPQDELSELVKKLVSEAYSEYGVVDRVAFEAVLVREGYDWVLDDAKFLQFLCFMCACECVKASRDGTEDGDPDLTEKSYDERFGRKRA